MTSKETQDITAAVQSKTEKATKAAAPYWEFGLLLPGKDKPVTYRLFAYDEGKPVSVGQTWRFRVSETPSPPTTQYPKGGTYRNIEGVLGIIDPSKQDDELFDEPERTGTAPATPDKPATRSERPWRSKSPDEQRSIEAQTALYAAIELAGHHIAKTGKEFSSAEVLKVAAVFAAWLAGLKVSAEAEGKEV